MLRAACGSAAQEAALGEKQDKGAEAWLPRRLCRREASRSWMRVGRDGCSV